MVCRCSSEEEHAQRAVEYESSSNKSTIDRLEKELSALRADVKSFDVEDVLALEGYLILKVKYVHPDGRTQKGCTFEGVKVMVYQNVDLTDVIKWRQIDPHFVEKKSTNKKKAPSPIARFPGNEQGWRDAYMFITAKINEGR